MRETRLNSMHLIALTGLFVVGCSPAAQSVPDSPGADISTTQQTPQATPYVLHWYEGELLTDSQGRTTAITVSPEMGSTDLSFWSTEIPPKSNVVVHRHERTEQIVFVHKGSGTFLLGDERINVQEGSVIYVPKGTNHGLENDSDHNMVIVEVVTPPDFVNFIRAISWPVDDQPRLLTDEEMKALEERYDSQLPGS